MRILIGKSAERKDRSREEFTVGWRIVFNIHKHILSSSSLQHVTIQVETRNLNLFVVSGVTRKKVNDSSFVARKE